jgi:hypothetical protein
MHTRDVQALADSVVELAEWLQTHATKLQETLNDQIEQYNNHQFNKWLLSNEQEPDQPTLP